MIPARKILVPVNGSEADSDAIALAAEVARPNKSEIIAIYVIEVKRTLPLDVDLPPEAARADEVLSRIEEMGRRDSVRIQTEILQARDVGTAIVDEALERQADLIVMGILYKRRFGDFDLGKTAPFVLRNAPCRVWVTREQAQIPESRTVQRFGEIPG